MNGPNVSELLKCKALNYLQNFTELHVQQWINRNCNAGTIFLMLIHMHIIVMRLPCRLFSTIHKYLYHLLSSLPLLTMF